MNTNVLVIQTFYGAFQQGDYKTMQDCYHPQITFSDPVFPRLEGRQVYAMWHMLCEAGQDLKIDFEAVGAFDSQGQARWQASYRFGKQQRMINNAIEARFHFKDGKIIRHEDRFDLWKWSSMAFGLPGTFLGWSSFMQDKIRKQAARGLHKFIARHPEYQ